MVHYETTTYIPRKHARRRYTQQVHWPLYRVCALTSREKPKETFTALMEEMEDESKKADLESNESPLLLKTSDRERKNLFRHISFRSPEASEAKAAATPSSDAKDEPDLEKGIVCNNGVDEAAEPRQRWRNSFKKIVGKKSLKSLNSLGRCFDAYRKTEDGGSSKKYTDMGMNEITLLLSTSEPHNDNLHAAPNSSSSSHSQSPSASASAAKDETDLEKGSDNGAGEPDPEELQQHVKEIVKEKNLQSLISFGGVEAVAKALNSSIVTGISGNTEDISQRKMVQVSQNWALDQNYFHFLKKSCKSPSIILLFFAGVMSLVFGMKKEGLKSGWFDGAIVFVTLFVLLLFSSIRKWLEARTASKKSQKEQILQEDLKVGVVRGGDNEVLISVSDLFCGDLACLKAGCLIPGDGIFVCGEGLEIDDGTLSPVCNKQNPFLFCGSRVVKGSAKMLVTSKGMDDTVLGERMKDAMILSPQKKTNIETYDLDKMIECINRGGLLISILILLVLILRFSVMGKIDDDSGNRPDSKGPPTELETILHSLKIILTESKGNARVLTALLSVSLVGIMEGIPFVVAIAIAYWNSKTLSDKASAKDVLTCVKMAKVTAICTDENVGLLKEHRIEIDEIFINSNSSIISDVCKAALRDGIGTTPHPAMDQPLLSWAERNIGLQRQASEKRSMIVDSNGENPFEEPCGVLVDRTKDSGKEFDMHFKGPVDNILQMCSFYYDPNGKMEAIDEEKKQELTEKMKDMQGKHLKVIAYACKSTNVKKLEGEELTFLGMFGLKDTSQQETRQLIESLVQNKIKIILLSPHDVAELNVISKECGICETDAEVRTSDELQQFRTDKEMFEMLESVKVVGKCNSALKQRIVRCLRSNGEVVAMLGARSYDTPVMKEADIGLAIKTEYSEITTEIADLIIVKGSFSLLIDMIICGRFIHENLQKFIQVEVIMTIASLLINFISVVFTGDSPLSAIQLFGIYLLISFPGGLALMSGQPNKNLKDTIRPTGPLITKAMWVNILLQSSSQIIIFVTLQLKGTAILRISPEVKESMIFNFFVFCQLFKIFSAREPKELNIFKGIHQNSWFWVGSGAFVVIHIPFVAVDHFIAGDAGLNWKQWLIGFCLIGAGTLLLDLAVKLLSVHTSRDWFIRMCRSTSMSLNATSAPPESMPSNLQNPLITGGSTTNTFQSSTSGLNQVFIYSSSGLNLTFLGASRGGRAELVADSRSRSSGAALVEWSPSPSRWRTGGVGLVAVAEQSWLRTRGRGAGMVAVAVSVSEQSWASSPSRSRAGRPGPRHRRRRPSRSSAGGVEGRAGRRSESPSPSLASRLRRLRSFALEALTS
nr:calcium-transporting ATPase 12, plasma membrane-type-like [Ipomoea batatas]